MIYGIYSIRDVCSGYLPITLDISDAVAERNFEHACVSTKDSLFFTHPDDYSLMKLGTFDSEHGTFDLLPHPKRLLCASDCIAVAKGRGVL
uniref:Nonstructural protein n=1 Tax=Dulem virus 119 TaxID=3145596 RepID=A0AAU8B154_9VIRU